MAAILKVKDENGNVIPIQAIQGEKGEKGDKGDKGDRGEQGLPGGIPISGGTATGPIKAPSFQTGDSDDAYFQTKKMRGEGDANTYYHAVDFGYEKHDQVDFHEYGGVWNFLKNTSGRKDTGTLVGKINSNGWNGGARLSGAPTAPTAAKGTNTTQIATTAFVKTATDGCVSASQGAENAGKVLTVGSDGIVVPSASSGGGSYTLPIASSTTLGGVKIGSGITVGDDGTISASGGGGNSASISGIELLLEHTVTEDENGATALTFTQDVYPKINSNRVLLVGFEFPEAKSRPWIEVWAGRSHVGGYQQAGYKWYMICGDATNGFWKNDTTASNGSYNANFWARPGYGFGDFNVAKTNGAFVPYTSIKMSSWTSWFVTGTVIKIWGSTT